MPVELEELELLLELLAPLELDDEDDPEELDELELVSPELLELDEELDELELLLDDVVVTGPSLSSLLSHAAKEKIMANANDFIKVFRFPIVSSLLKW